MKLYIKSSSSYGERSDERHLKKVSISVNTLNRMERSGLLYDTLDEALQRCKYMNDLGNSFEVCEAYEMGDNYKRIEYKVFRGYFLKAI